MLGLILGDIVGSRFEKQKPPVTKAFDLITEKCRFTDDTVLSCAVAKSIMDGTDFTQSIIEFHDKYPYAGYGKTFKEWAAEKGDVIYESFGNGSAMRVAPIGWAFSTEEEVLAQAELTAKSSHAHEEGIKGAKAIALAVFMARKGFSKKDIKVRIEKLGYKEISWINVDLHDQFDATCQGTVPQAIWAFIMSNSMEDAIRRAVWIGGDADTLAAMTGAIAHAFYYRDKPIEEEYVKIVFERLPKELADIVKQFMVQHVDRDFVTSVEQSKDALELTENRMDNYLWKNKEPYKIPEKPLALSQ